MPTTTSVHLRPATASDIPRMVDILIAAFAPGPWSGALFPPRLRSGPHDESEWRARAVAEHLGGPGHQHVVAVRGEPTGEAAGAGGGGGGGGGYVVGWAHWRVAAARDGERAGEARGPRAEGPPGGLDTEALEALRREGVEIEKMAMEALGEDRWGGAIELDYLQVDPGHQRQGIGRLLAQEGLGRADAGGREVWLRSTPEGRCLYLSLGFRVVGEGSVLAQAQYAMVRRARPLRHVAHGDIAAGAAHEVSTVPGDLPS